MTVKLLFLLLVIALFVTEAKTKGKGKEMKSAKSLNGKSDPKKSKKQILEEPSTPSENSIQDAIIEAGNDPMPEVEAVPCECSTSHSVWALDYTGSTIKFSENINANTKILAWQKQLAILENLRMNSDFITAFGYGNFDPAPQTSQYEIEIQEWAAHEDPSTFNPYTIVTPLEYESSYDEAFKKFADILDNSIEQERVTLLMVSDGGEQFTEAQAAALMTSIANYELRTGCSVRAKCFLAEVDRPSQFDQTNIGFVNACERIGAGVPMPIPTGVPEVQ